MIGNNVSMLTPSEHRKHHDKLRRRCIKAEHVRNVESVRTTKSGEIHPILLTMSLLTSDSGKPLAIASIAKDITERKQAEQAAKDEVKRRDHFLAMLSHELRNPLSAILTAVGLLDRPHTDGALERVIGVLRRQSEQMGRLLDDLLDVARITHGKIRFRLQPLDLRLIADDAAEAIRGMMEARAHELSISVPTEPLPVQGDRTRIL